MIPENSLENLIKNHHGKTFDRWSLYLRIYDDVLQKYKSKNINLLEVGVQNGGSLEIWSKYFQFAENLIGCDIDEKCAFLEYDHDSRIKVIIGDITKDDTIDKIKKNVQNFDIIIDDGSHTSSDIIQTFGKLFSSLNHDGLYIIEDLHCSYWPNYNGGLYHPKSSINFLKKISDIVNFEHIHRNENLTRSYLLNEFDVQMREDVLTTIHSICFFNSVCVIKKNPAYANVLGERVCIGNDASVNPYCHPSKHIEAFNKIKNYQDLDLTQSSHFMSRA